jgi:hypothetical protein
MLQSHQKPAPPSWLWTKVSNWFWSLTPACKEVARLTSEAREHPLPLGMRSRLDLHRCFCQWCARYARQLDLIHEASQLLPERAESLIGPGLDGSAKVRMKAAVRDAI